MEPYLAVTFLLFVFCHLLVLLMYCLLDTFIGTLTILDMNSEPQRFSVAKFPNVVCEVSNVSSGGMK